MPEHKYGKRVCLQCGKEFEARYPAHVTCSKECYRERRREMQRIWDARSAAKRKQHLHDLETELDEVWAELEWLNCHHVEMRIFLSGTQTQERAELDLAIFQMEQLKLDLEMARLDLAAARAAAMQPVEKPAPAPASRPEVALQSVEKVAACAGLPPLQECPRMRLKAVTLPCGEHEPCHKPTRCARLGGNPDAAIVLEPGEKRCKQCGAAFTPNAPAQKYCTKKCHETALKQKIYRRK